MKHLKTLFLFVVTLVFTLSLVMLELNVAVKFTLFSPSFFSKLAEDSKFTKAVVEALKIPDRTTIYDASPWDPDEFPPLRAIFLDSMDKTWLEGQAPVMLKGIHAYIIGKTEVLPTLDFKPVKENLQNNAMKELSRVTQKDSEDKKLKEKKRLEERMKLGSVKETLDLNMLSQELYQKQGSPLSQLRTFLSKYNKYVFYSILLVTMLLIVIIILAAFNPKSALRWLPTGMLVSAFLGLVIGLLGSGGFLIGLIAGGVQGDAGALELMGAAFLGEFTKVMLVQASILLVLGIMLFVLGFVVSKKVNFSVKNSEGGNEKKVEVISRIRWATILVLVIAIPIVVLNSISNMKTASQEVVDKLADPSNELKRLNFTGAMAVTTGTEFLNEKFDPSNAVEDRTQGILMSVLFEVTDKAGKPISSVVLAVNKDKPDGPKDPGYYATGRDGRVKFSLKEGKYFIKPSSYGFPQNLKMPQKALEVDVKKDQENEFKLMLERK
ncbi:MAG: hypothetical protein N2484_09505 [Clostridia bacterium]|nr:hypothetical protein [Clostridia bacterium]